MKGSKSCFIRGLLVLRPGFGLLPLDTETVEGLWRPPTGLEPANQGSAKGSTFCVSRVLAAFLEHSGPTMEVSA